MSELPTEYRSPVDSARARAIETLRAIPDPSELSDTQLDEHIGMLQDLSDDVLTLQERACREAMRREGYLRALGRSGLPMAIAELEDPVHAEIYGLSNDTERR